MPFHSLMRHLLPGPIAHSTNSSALTARIPVRGGSARGTCQAQPGERGAITHSYQLADGGVRALLPRAGYSGGLRHGLNLAWVRLRADDAWRDRSPADSRIEQPGERGVDAPRIAERGWSRSEEHTSELQS